jgi:hypothetical protein
LGQFGKSVNAQPRVISIAIVRMNVSGRSNLVTGYAHLDLLYQRALILKYARIEWH